MEDKDGTLFADDAPEPAPKAEVHQDPPEETVGDIMKKSGSDAVKFWVIVISAFVYLAGIVYAEVHGLTMLQKGVAPDMRIWATLGIIAAGISAVILPVALKTWTIEAKQRIATYAFYLLDFGFLVFNAFTDFNQQTGATLAPWAQSYVTYILPASPIVVAACWALLWELDPGVREKITLLTLRAAMKKKMADKVADAARGQNVTEAVNAAASREVERALTELFGAPVSGYVMNAADLPPRKGLLQSFFGWLSELGPLMSSPTMPSQSQKPGSEDQEEPQQNP
jgi:hypothetical protein